MKKLQYLLKTIGVVQLVLGTGLLLAPLTFVKLMGLSEVPNDGAYLLGMLAARFLAYGVGMFYVARDPGKEQFWVKNMLAIQLIDLAVGIFYTANGTLPLSVSAFPMFNAFAFSLLLTIWSPEKLNSTKN